MVDAIMLEGNNKKIVVILIELLIINVFFMFYQVGYAFR